MVRQCVLTVAVFFLVFVQVANAQSCRTPGNPDPGGVVGNVPVNICSRVACCSDDWRGADCAAGASSTGSCVSSGDCVIPCSAVDGLCLEMYANAKAGTTTAAPLPDGCSAELLNPWSTFLHALSCVNPGNATDNCTAAVNALGTMNPKPDLVQIKAYFLQEIANAAVRDQYATPGAAYSAVLSDYKSRLSTYVNKYVANDGAACSPPNKLSVALDSPCSTGTGCTNCLAFSTPATSSSYTTAFDAYAQNHALCATVSGCENATVPPDPPPVRPLAERTCDQMTFTGTAGAVSVTKAVCNDLKSGFNAIRFNSIYTLINSITSDSISRNRLLEALAVARAYYAGGTYADCANYITNYAGGSNFSLPGWTPDTYRMLWGCKIMFNNKTFTEIKDDLKAVFNDFWSKGLNCPAIQPANSLPKDSDIWAACHLGTDGTNLFYE